MELEKRNGLVGPTGQSLNEDPDIVVLRLQVRITKKGLIYADIGIRDPKTGEMSQTSLQEDSIETAIVHGQLSAIRRLNKLAHKSA